MGEKPQQKATKNEVLVEKPLKMKVKVGFSWYLDLRLR